jgi:uncharacterized membrane protein (DUF106 family)
MIQQSETFYTITFVLLTAILVGLGIFLLTFMLLWISSVCSYKKRMKPLNEAVEKQRKEAAERRKRMFSS